MKHSIEVHHIQVLQLQPAKCMTWPLCHTLKHASMSIPVEKRIIVPHFFVMLKRLDRFEPNCIALILSVTSSRKDECFRHVAVATKALSCVLESIAIFKSVMHMFPMGVFLLASNFLAALPGPNTSKNV